MINLTPNLRQTMRAVTQTAFGPAESLIISNKNIPSKPEHGDHVLIKVASTALNRADLLMRQGRYPNQGEKLLDLGLEVAGTDENGKSVMALLKGGGYSEYVYAPRSQVMAVPKGMDLVEAAAIPEVWLTAWQLLTFVAKLEPLKPDTEKYILIHGGASGVGTAATQLASKILNYKVITTAGTTEKCDATLALGASHAINYKENTDWAAAVSEITNKKGVSVVLDCVGGGDYVEKNIKSLSFDGIWVLYGFLNGTQIPKGMDGKFLAMILGKRISLLGTTLNARSGEYKEELVKDFSEKCLPKFDEGVLKPVVDKVFGFEEVAGAHKYMESNQNIGKILLQI